MTLAAVGANSQALWYMTRGFGIVALILLTTTTVLGLAQAGRYARPGLPRFVISALHRNGSLLAISAISVHVITAVLDTFAPVHLIDVFVPYASRYRPLWTGIGALALDLMLAVVITSLLRGRIGYQAWKAVHWAAYASWPIAMVHGLGTGTDARVGWVLFIYVACTAAVLGALWWRLARYWNPARAAARGTAVAVSLGLPVMIAAWAASGPLKAGWARRAGTPGALLAPPAATGGTGSGGTSAAGAAPGPAAPSAPGLALPLSARLVGTQSETGPDSSGLVSVVITGTFQPVGSASPGLLRLVLTGQPVEGGVSLTGSQVSIGTASQPAQYSGHVSQLEGSVVIASLRNSSGQMVTAVIRLELSRESGRVRGELQVQA